MSCAADSMLRRSWLMRATAMPSSASRLRCLSSWASELCIVASAASARPISSSRPLGAMTRALSCGRSPKAMMFEVSRRTGRITSDHSAAHSTQVTTAEMISDRTRKLREMRHIASISGDSSSVTSIVAPSLCDRPMTRTSDPGWANSVRKAA